MTFDETIKALALHIRSELQEVETISRLDFNIHINGRVHDGDLHIEFSIGASYSDGGQVKAGSIPALLTEYKRRFGWDKRNAPLCIGFDGAVDDIAF